MYVVNGSDGRCLVAVRLIVGVRYLERPLREVLLYISDRYGENLRCSWMHNTGRDGISFFKSFLATFVGGRNGLDRYKELEITGADRPNTAFCTQLISSVTVSSPTSPSQPPWD